MGDNTCVGLLRYRFVEALCNAALERAERCAEQGLEWEETHYDLKLGLWRARGLLKRNGPR